MTKPVLLWFRQDLRLSDHPALVAALKTDQPVIPVYIFDQTTPGIWAMGGASLWWLHQSLNALDENLRQKGAQLILRKGETVSVLRDLVHETEATAIYFTRGYDPCSIRLERQIVEDMGPLNVACKRYSGALLFEPEAVMSGSGEPYKVFTPFWRACLQKEEPKKPLPKPDHFMPCDIQVSSENLLNWKLLPENPNWAKGFSDHWKPGEDGARERIYHFLEAGLMQYDEQRNIPSVDGTSRLSPHLHFGEISPRQCWHSVKAYLQKNSNAEKGGNSFLRELGWREFSTHLLFHWPDLPEKNFKQEFDSFPWEGQQEHLKLWQKGLTGFPIVDAGMRELWTTGWMHNRVRMIVASFLIKDLLISWREGEAWFWDTLVDADLANNAASWQWVAGSGADAAPYFRIFNPVLQSEKFDPKGLYIRRWVPELAELSDKDIHAPWLASEAVLRKSNVVLGQTYPRPIVDHGAARNRALELYKTLKT